MYNLNYANVVQQINFKLVELNSRKEFILGLLRTFLSSWNRFDVSIHKILNVNDHAR